MYIVTLTYRSPQNPEKPSIGSKLQVLHTLTIHGLPIMSVPGLFNTLSLSRSSRSSECRVFEMKKERRFCDLDYKLMVGDI